MKIPQSIEKLYTMREASATLKVHPNTIRRWDKEGKITVVRTGRGHRRVPESEINRLIYQTSPIMAQTHPSVTKEEELSTFLNFIFSFHRDDWDLVKKAVIIRDNYYTCQECGSKELVGVHHKNGTNRNDSENLVTLCQKCHDKIHAQALPQVPEQKIVPETPPLEKPAITEKIPITTPPSEIEIPRHIILDALSPAGLAQRTTFGDLLSAAAMLGNFILSTLSARAHCPEAVAETFCKRMIACGYLATKDGIFEMKVKVIR